MNKQELINYVVNSHVRNELDINELLRLIHLLPDEIELNENQQIVFEWLKSRVEAGYSCFDAVQSIRGFNSVPGKALNAFMILDEKEKRLVLAAFSEWGMKEVAE
nr:MAG TPA: hypothetical protein [Caudoviricetes sp.]